MIHRYKFLSIAVSLASCAMLLSSIAGVNHYFLASTTSAERNTAQQVMQTAIVNAAGVRSASLITLGSAPTPPAL